jgi:hypothetical protein
MSADSMPYSPWASAVSTASGTCRPPSRSSKTWNESARVSPLPWCSAGISARLAVIAHRSPVHPLGR